MDKNNRMEFPLEILWLHSLEEDWGLLRYFETKNYKQSVFLHKKATSNFFYRDVTVIGQVPYLPPHFHHAPSRKVRSSLPPPSVT